ncbi:MAG: 3-methyladenine DNA glycosylase [Verrucomicrobia bacterium]|nr:MAG: 3-methyladenine DNA glycosylase [Verrucomicrobiota bacterium]
MMNRLQSWEWTSRAERHAQRATETLAAARDRKTRGVAHPIEDFLFDYYPYPFSLLENWHPGFGWELGYEGDELPKPFSARDYALEDGWIRIAPEKMPGKEAERLKWILNLLECTQNRAPIFSCHGMHEWAMVYGMHEIRHAGTAPLRLSAAEIRKVVEHRPLMCTHHDAFRFFSNDAKPFNRFAPSIHKRELLEQPGCVHANMDLYKWAAKAMPWIGTERLFDCFELARDLRELDMRASPYDLSAWGRAAICIETEQGRREYEEMQRDLAERAKPLRKELVASIRQVLTA